MSKRYNIQWTENQKYKLDRAVRNFNAKLTRVLEKNPELAEIQPHKVSIKELKGQIHSTQDLNRIVNELKRFSAKGAEEVVQNKSGLKETKYVLREVTIKAAAINRQRTIERKRVLNMPATSRGQDLGLTRGQMGDTRINNLRPIKPNFGSKRYGSEWQHMKNTIDFLSDRRDTNENYKQNYLKALQNGLPGYYERLKAVIDKIPASKVVEMYYRDQEAKIDFPYEEQQAQAKFEILMDIWTAALDEVDS